MTEKSKAKTKAKSQTKAQQEPSSTQPKNYPFQAEVKELLHLMVHALYSNQDIFLRELIANASDALDKLRFSALSDDKLYEQDKELCVRIAFDKEAQTITISDNGIGMSETEVIEHLGTIAHSGTKAYLERLKGQSQEAIQQIGQFGVGFYSAFMVAREVTVRTRKAGLGAEQGVVWRSQGAGEFTIEPITKAERGTEIVLALKPEAKTYLDTWKLKSIITQYADHISWPIVMTKPVDNKTTEASDDKDKPADQSQAEPKTEDETVNQAQALWTLPPSEIKDEDYENFYQHLTNDYEKPLRWAHHRVEGKQQYTLLLYLPSHAPYDMNQAKGHRGLKLYVQRVFILDHADVFLPNYLRFVKGVVDANDLPLNVSRELLQSHPLVDSIKSGATKKALALIEKLSEDKNQYATFWQAFGETLKEGMMEDHANRKQLAKLFRFTSTQAIASGQTVSLDDYIERMQEKQSKIYYLLADSLEKAQSSPHLEYPKQQNIEVLLLHDKIDAWWISHLREYQGKTLQAVTEGMDDSQDEEQKKQLDELEEQKSSLIKQMKEVLQDKVRDVKLTTRLTDSPACLTGQTSQPHFTGMMTAGSIMTGQAVLEINPEHAVIQALEMVTDDDHFRNWCQVIYHQALLAQGGTLQDPREFVQNLNAVLAAQAKQVV